MSIIFVEKEKENHFLMQQDQIVKMNVKANITPVLKGKYILQF